MHINSIFTHNNFYSPTFNGSTDKALKILKTTRNVKALKITPDVAIKIYKNLGYDVTFNTGSHITITHPNGMKFPMVLPHGGEKKYISADYVKTLQCAVFDDFQKLVQSLHYHRN